MQILIENESAEDVNSLFRITLNSQTVATHLTAAQAHYLIGEIFERALRSTSEPVVAPQDERAYAKNPQ